MTKPKYAFIMLMDQDQCFYLYPCESLKVVQALKTQDPKWMGGGPNLFKTLRLDTTLGKKVLPFLSRVRTFDGRDIIKIEQDDPSEPYAGLWYRYRQINLRDWQGEEIHLKPALKALMNDLKKWVKK